MATAGSTVALAIVGVVVSWLAISSTTYQRQQNLVPHLRAEVAVPVLFLTAASAFAWRRGWRWLAVGLVSGEIASVAFFYLLSR